MMILLLFIALPIILIHLFKKSRNSTRNDVVPPGPPRLPLIGNLHQFGVGAAGNLPFYLWKLSKKYGPIIHLKLGSVPAIVISSPELAEQVLKTQDLAFCSRPKLLWQQKITYNYMDMVFAPYGDYWREVRKITAVHLFSLKKVQSFRLIREDEVSRMITKIRSIASSSSSCVVNLSEITMSLGITMICRAAFGRRYDEHGHEMRRFEKLLHEANDLMGTFFVSDYLPSLSWVDKLTGAISKLDKTFVNLDLFYQELIDEHLHPMRAMKKKKEKEEMDILDVLIQLKEEGSCSIDFSWDQIKALLTDIFLAGTDTSAASIVWMMTALIKAPTAMKKLQQEIRNLVGRKGSVDEDDIHHLPYLKAVVNETFRLYPSLPILVPRETIATCSLHGYQIQPKTMVLVNAWAVARDAGSWENPHEFSPERFLTSNADIKGRDFGLIPFGSGRRICPGMHMGLAIVELAVANLLYSFDWEPPPGTRPQDIDTDPLPGVTMHKKEPLLLEAKTYTSTPI